MSRVSNSKIIIPSDVKVKIEADLVYVSGKLGELKVNVIPGVTYVIENGIIRGEGKSSAHVGTAMRLLSNAVSGVCKHFESVIEIHDANVRVKQEGQSLIMNIGYSHDVKVDIPSGIEVLIDANKNRKVELKIKSICKAQVSEFIDSIIRLKKSRPYLDYAVIKTSIFGVAKPMPVAKSSKGK